MTHDIVATIPTSEVEIDRPLGHYSGSGNHMDLARELQARTGVFVHEDGDPGVRWKDKWFGS
jgi:hypothetical protein